MLKKFIVGFLILFVVAALVVRFGAPRYAEYRLDFFLRSADSASYEILELDLWAGTVDIRNLYLQDTAGNLAKYPVFINLDRIALKNISLWQIYRNKVLLADSAVVGTGLVSIGLHKKNESIQEKLKDRKSRPLPIWKYDIKNILVDTLTADVYFEKSLPDARIRTDLHLSGTDLYLDQFARNSLSVSSLNLWARNFYFQGEGADTYFTISKAAYNSASQQLTIEDVEVDQRTPREALAKKHGFDKLHSHLLIDKIAIFGLPSDMNSFLNGIQIPKIEIDGVQAFLYKDKRYPHPKALKLFGLQHIAKLELDVEIDTIQLKNGSIIYEENWRSDGRLAMLDIGNINATVYNVGNTNTEKKYTQVYGTLDLLNELPLKVDWRWKRNNAFKSFDLKVDIGKMPASAFNSYSKNALDVIIKKGDILGGQMVVHATDIAATGTLKLNYTNLRIQILENKSHDSNFGLWLGSAAVNFVVHNNNLPNDKERMGIIDMKRDTTRSEFSYIAKIFLDGADDILVGPRVKAPSRNLRQKLKDKKAAKKKK